ncbi:hypothetical protein CHLRE_16g653450v5 [Chlamydomonas reinhardtii]|uniref:BAR domain-containing protein n=1 Tax=Chlamydomonas reinhardtii TaxID=3055 RepID=A0A2K3CT21_CHLRE|nr:uncharacterized protein CHLRE_16g653450v5 [Chlamydomonas reinhardtii]PNW71418.1 hypothetical protein CHLRE_16g653450v5 [Chlamydomonas reinhardtii]
MGYGWRRVMETMRQKVGTDKAFVATSNARNEAMFKEATDFCNHLRLLERDLRSMHKEIDAKFANLRAILSSPLPRTYEEGANGVVPVSEEAKLIGQGIAVDRLQESANELRQRLDDEVIKPLRSWLMAYRTVSERMEKLEALRLELDSRRRTVDSLEEKCDKLHKTAPAAKDKDKHEQEMEKMSQLLLHKQDKCNRTKNAFEELEKMVYNSLNTLVKDTGVLRDYTGLSLSILQDCFQRGHSAFSTATPLLDYNSTSDNHMYNHAPSAYHHQHLPVIERAASERAGLVRQLTEQRPRAPSSKGEMDALNRNVALYCEDGGADVLPPYDVSPRHHPAGDKMQMQMQQGPGTYPEVPQMPMGGQQAGGNPYSAAYQQSPHATRYMTSPAPAQWQGQQAQY